MEQRVVAVVVTWNRRALLEEALDALARQSLVPAGVVVVDNASTDGTDELLGHRQRLDPTLDVVRLRENVGGAGGFAAGIERALSHAPDVVWLLDDDTVPTPTAAEVLAGAWTAYDGRARPAVLASKVVWTDGRDHPMNTPRPKPGASRREKAAAARVGATPIRSASFVSVMCDVGAIRERGLPIADFFLWNDDFEYTTRLIRGRAGLSCPDSVVVHKTRTFGSTDADPGPRFFYEVRNKIWTFTRSSGLTLPEKALYAGSTLRRWARTVVGSSDRATLLSGLRKGLRAGLSAPRSNAQVLAAAGWAGVDGVDGAEDADRRLPAGQPFSLLISTYGGDDPGYLRQAFASSVDEQTRRPAQVVLVQDGPVPDAHAAAIRELIEASPVPVEHVQLDANVGLGPALGRGLDACRHEIVARMDADDISEPERFERQIPVIEAGADIVGTGLVEFGTSPDDVVGRRTPPTDPAEIRRVVAFRDPFNHPTVVYRKSAVLASGGYPDLDLMEDYLLFGQMLHNGARPANLAEPLVRYRVGAGAYARRGGVSLLRSEIALQRRFRVAGITSRAQYVRNLVLRGGYRLVPEGVRRVTYRTLIANRGAGNG